MKEPAFVALLGVSLLAGCEKAMAPPPAPPVPAQSQITKPNPKLQTLKLWLGAEELITELALTAEQQMTGMMFRTNILESEGMLFALPYPQQASFYMKNTLVPLSVAYIDPDGRILEVNEFEALNEEAVPSRSYRVLYVLEMKEGWFGRNGVVPGAIIQTEQGPLKDHVKFIPQEPEKAK